MDNWQHELDLVSYELPDGWMPLSVYWNMVECDWVCMNAFGQVLNMIEWNLAPLSECEHVWVSLDARECILLLIPTSDWVCTGTQFNMLECVWMPLNKSVCDLMWLSALMPVSEYWTYMNEVHLVEVI